MNQSPHNSTLDTRDGGAGLGELQPWVGACYNGQHVSTTRIEASSADLALLRLQNLFPDRQGWTDHHVNPLCDACATGHHELPMAGFVCGCICHEKL